MIAAEVEMQTFYLPTDQDSKIVVVHTGEMEEWCDANLASHRSFAD